MSELILITVTGGILSMVFSKVLINKIIVRVTTSDWHGHSNKYPQGNFSLSQITS